MTQPWFVTFWPQNVITSSLSPTAPKLRIWQNLQKTQSINGVAREPGTQVSAQNTHSGECTLKLQIVISDSCRFTATAIATGVLKLHFCLNRTGHVSFHVCRIDRKTCRKRALVGRGFITTPGVKFPGVCIRGPEGGFPNPTMLQQYSTYAAWYWANAAYGVPVYSSNGNIRSNDSQQNNSDKQSTLCPWRMTGWSGSRHGSVISSHRQLAGTSSSVTTSR